MALAGSQLWSSDTLAAGIDTLREQGVKLEPSPESREAMQRELEELQQQRKAYVDQVSEHSPNRVLKKHRVNFKSPSDATYGDSHQGPPSPAPEVRKSLFSTDGKMDGEANDVQDASIFGATGDCPEEDALVKRMRERMEALTLENRELAQENAAMRAELENRKVLQTGEPDQQEPEGVTDEAARKRLERICKRRADGTLTVPESIHDAWKKGGDTRNNLLKALTEANFNKEEFVKMVKIQEENKEQVQYKCWAGWASEEKMRDTLKIKETRITAIKQFCAQREGFVKHDRYEGKPLYWVEEEIEVEYFKTLSRSRNEQSEYQVASTAESVFGEAAEPVRMDMGLAAGGMPSSAPAGPQQVPQKPGQAGGNPFPPVLKSELPSDHILKYMEGLTKKSLKISELKAKYEAIPVGDRSVAHTGFIGKLELKVKDLDQLHGEINDVYASGAVEGYADKHEVDLRELYKKATKSVQDALTLESRSKAIPLPKAKPLPNKPGAKMPAKAKAKAKAAPNCPDEELPSGGGRRASKKK
mmetsp:Transcript_39505/g.85259  ORF Transcript_39505/g.85259 Transcript_39505/m.85259 type:complete len:531 (+) Transcript_39505:45-1637(+)